jgi:hypothetical protein
MLHIFYTNNGTKTKYKVTNRFGKLFVDSRIAICVCQGLLQTTTPNGWYELPTYLGLP